LSLFTGRFEEVSFEQISSAYTSMRGAEAPWSVLPLPRSPWREWRTILGAAARFPRYAYRVIGHFLGDLAKAHTPGDEKDLLPGDVIVSVGSSWVIRNFCAHMARLKRDHKVRFVQVVHDIIPILYPGWTPGFGRAFRRWVKNVAAVSDVFVTNSRTSHMDLKAFAAAEGFALPPVRTIRFGTGFPSGFRSKSPDASRTSGVFQSLPERFVLCVSTLENRKNHELLLTVWRNLLAAHGSSKIPYLVLVGRVGYFLIDTLSLRVKVRERRLQQRIIATGQLKDAELAEVYRRCLFTVFPSLYEGWGLPVEESLAHGKFCVASNSSSMPEVGGDWIDYFDPRNAADARRVLERALFEPGYLEAREQRIRAQYRPYSWRNCTRELIQHAEQLTEARIPMV
jgi:glycosyltransferase involved in cell wall biosynthesis